MKILLVLGALNSALAVMLGAFGAHGLKSRVDESMLATWATASEYHFYHALALLLTGLLAKAFGAPSMVTAGWVLFAGMLVFSGSLYVLVLSGQQWLRHYPIRRHGLNHWLANARLVPFQTRLIKIMKLTVNGDTLTLNGNTIADLVSQLELTGRRLAVEVNREIIPKSQHSDFALNEDDVVEIVHAIGGG